ncbi:MAG: PilT/PilU family type 4a pilus ATPase [Bdellovibrionales bacterium]|nr:PilT/PilU family type 4a pilus ATPase [Bdellovibrionales bacterium]
MDIDKLLTELVHKGGSDLHLKVGAPPIMRKKTKLCTLSSDLPIINNHTIDQLIAPILTDNYQEQLREYGSVDLGYGLKGIGRFRFNIFFQRGSIRVAVRHIPHNVPLFNDLNLPMEILNIVNKAERGLILVTGATGVGKSTTLAAIINHINKTKNKHILTIEDPIEFLIQDHHSLITQREMGVDCYDPHLALKSALRQDPDIILFSELRTKDVISTALTAAETGHLIFSTIHTQEAAETINRILSVFSSVEQQSVRLVLSSVLKAVFAQRLIPKKDGTGYIPAMEILINNYRVQKEIEKQHSSTEQIRKIMTESKNHWGMQTFDQHLIEMMKQKLISKRDANRFSTSAEKIKLISSGISFENQFEKYMNQSAPEQITKTQDISSTGLSLKTKTNAS